MVTKQQDWPAPLAPTPSADLAMWASVNALVGTITQRLDQLLETNHQITLSELLTLRALEPCNARGARIQDVARQVGISPSSMSRLVSRLQARDLVDRVTCEFDKRGVYAALNPRGTDLLNDATRSITPTLTAELDNAAYQPTTAAAVARLRYAPTD